MEISVMNIYKCKVPIKIASLPLTDLLLDCWQREYDRRPYKNFILHRKVFEGRMQRSFNLHDFQVIVGYIGRRCIRSIQWLFVTMPIGENWELFMSKIHIVLNLELVNVDLPVEFLKALADERDMKLQTLRIPGNELTMEHIEYLRLFLIRSKTIKTLDVSHCSINEITFSLLVDGVCQSLSLTKFIVNNIERLGSIGSVDTTKLSMLISIMFWKNTLTKLELQNCKLTAHDMEPISEYLSNSDSCLLELNLCGNIIATDGTQHLFNAILKSNVLQKLDISINNLGDHGGQIIAHNLCRTNLIELKICKNNILADTMNLILSTIKKTKPLQLLHISGNYFNSKGGNILNRLIAAGVITTDMIDVSVVFDIDNNVFVVLSQPKHYNLNFARYCVPHPENFGWPNCLPYIE